MKNPFTTAQKFFSLLCEYFKDGQNRRALPKFLASSRKETTLKINKSMVRGDECCLVTFAMGQNRLKSLA